jgi:hypothetical protein
MNYTINPIETRYKGTTFRSRLEAKWAAMFDLLGWNWKYEPCDFNGWIPDFAIIGKRSHVFVEVKPVFLLPPEVAKMIEKSRCTDDVIVVGSTCPTYPIQKDDQRVSFGWINEFDGCDDLNPDGFFGWGNAVLGRWGQPTGNQIGFCHSDASFVDRITGKYDGGCYGSGLVDRMEIELMWNNACHVTRWNKGAGRTLK